MSAWHSTADAGPLDMIDRPDARPEIELYYWDVKGDFKKARKTSGFFNSKQKPDLIIIMDPPYFDKKQDDYAQKSIFMLPRQEGYFTMNRFLLA